VKQFKRSDRVAEEIRRIVSEQWDSEIAAKVSGMVTFTRVDLSGDLRYAKVYYSFLGDESEREKVATFLVQQNKRLRYMIGSKLRLRHIPEFNFKFDPSIEEGIRIERLLNEIKRDGQE